MAEKRKLLNEIDKCFKKIEEGVELFEETMSKMQEANSDNQREKFQDDLKKEIKKLQRLRDQIKGWQNSSDIKDKDRLTHYRKLIEQRMEQFKDIERENKTKPHSKQGLSAEEKLDPREKEKADTVEWLQCQIRFLEDESDKTESQIESISTTEQTRKKGKRDDPKKGEKEKLKKLEDLRKHLERMKFHASKLEICMRLVNNETLESKKVMETLKEQFELYIDALDPDSENDAESFDPEASGVYDELDLQSYTPQLGGAIFGANEMDEKVDNNGDSKSSSSVSPTPVLPKELEDNSTKQRHLSGEATVTLSRQISSTRSTPATPLKLTNQVSVEGSSLNSPPPPATPPPPPGIPYSVAAGLGTKSGKGAVIQTLVKQPVDVVRQPSGVISVTTTTTTTASVAQQSAAAQQQQSAPQQITANDNDSTTSTPLHIDMPPPLSSQPAALSPVIVPASGSSTPESNLVKRFSASSSTSSQQEVMPMKGVVMSSSSTQGGGAPVDVVPSSALSLTSSSAIVIQQQQQQQQQQAVQSSPSAPQQQSPNTNPTTIPQPPSQPHTATLTPTSTPLLNQQQPSSLLSSHHTQLQQLSTQSSNTTSNAINSAINASSAASCNLANATTLPSANEIDSNALRQVLRIASSTHDARNQLPQSAVIPAWLGASPLGRAPITPEHDVQLNLLEHALTRTPLQMDSEKPRSYLPKMPCATASYYPQSPPANADTLEYYLRLSPETLFFTFYYMEGSRAQLLAAKALKKLSWRFHTKYLMWFQRHEEPKQITDDYEQGTYVYFDFEKWSQRKKEQFTFEYRYLEDKDFD